jgi:hypothetical protein
MTTLRPPLPAPLSHDGITFVVGDSNVSGVSEEALMEIASALTAALPAGDFEVSPGGRLVYAEPEGSSQWRVAGRIESIQRGSR